MQYGHTEKKMPFVALSANKQTNKRKKNHHKDPAPDTTGNFTYAFRNHPSGWNSSHSSWQENPSDKGMIKFQLVLVYKTKGYVHQGIGIKWTLHCKISLFSDKKVETYWKTVVKGSGLLQPIYTNQISDQRACPALGRHHDRHRSHPLQRGLAHGVWVRVLPVCGRHHWLEAHRAIAAHHGRRGWGRVCGDHESLWWWECVAAICKWSCCCCCGLSVTGQWCWAWSCDVPCILGLSVSMCTVGSSGEGLACVSIVASVRVGVIVRFWVVPVAAVVGVRRGKCVVLWGGGICMESLHRWWPFRRKVIFSVEDDTKEISVWL